MYNENVYAESMSFKFRLNFESSWVNRKHVSVFTMYSKFIVYQTILNIKITVNSCYCANKNRRFFFTELENTNIHSVMTQLSIIGKFPCGIKA